MRIEFLSFIFTALFTREEICVKASQIGGWLFYCEEGFDVG